MMRIALWFLIIIVLANPCVSPAAIIGLDRIEIDPPGAGIHGQTVTLTLSGIWLDTCVPQFIEHEVGEGEIIVSAVNPGGPLIGCGDALTPWELRVQVGPLTHGAYDILGQTAHYIWPEESQIVLDEGPEVFIEDYPVIFLLGDMNGDGRLDAFDVAPFELALADEAAYRARYLDVDPIEIGNFAEDTVFNAHDISGFEAALAGGLTATVPVPATIGMLVVGLAIATTRRK